MMTSKTYVARMTHEAFGEHDVPIEAASDAGARRGALASLRDAGHGWTVQLRDETGRAIAARSRGDRKWTAIA
jgi:hypothetical protein